MVAASSELCEEARGEPRISPNPGAGLLVKVMNHHLKCVGCDDPVTYPDNALASSSPVPPEQAEKQFEFENEGMPA
jgi:hypothetical protein